MKKLVCYFVLLSSLFCGVSGASSSGSSNHQVAGFSQEALFEFANTDPYQTMNKIFNKRLKYNDYRERERIIATPRVISQAYPNRPDLQRQAIDAFGQCMKNQIVNGKKKYTDHDVNIVVNFSKKKLGLN